MANHEIGATTIQHVFLDVVRFTQNRTVEAQAHIVGALNEIVRASLEEVETPSPDCILLPTGDGIAIAIPQSEPFDLSLKLAQNILTNLHNYNTKTQDQQRKFEIRIGINQNSDNIIIDINGNRNVAGRGINMAQRIMSLADGGQIMLGQQVFEILREREAYANFFRELPGKDKHGAQFSVYQYIRNDIQGLNQEIPSQLRPTSPAKPQMSEYVAHFIAHAVLHRDFLMNRRSDSHFDRAATVLLHLLTRDSMDNIKKSPMQDPMHRVDLNPSGSPESGYESIAKSDFWTAAELANHIREKLWPVAELFEKGNYQTLWPFPTSKGKQNAEEKFPKIWAFVMGQPVDLTPDQEQEI